jgi:hypothetical protein
MDTVDIRIKGVKIDTDKFRKFFGYDQYELTGIKTGDVKEYEVPPISHGKFRSKDIGINYIGGMKKPSKVNDVYNLELVKVSIPKLLGYADNNVIINNKRKIDDAFSKLVKTLNSMGIECKKKEIEFTRIDFPLHIEVEEFDEMRMLFNLILKKYEGKIFFIHDSKNYLRDNRSTGIEFCTNNGIVINIYDKLRQMKIEKKPGEKDIVRVETRFMNITVIKSYLGGHSYENITLDKIKSSISKVFEEIKDKVFNALVEEVLAAENLHYLSKNDFEKNLMRFSHMFPDKEVVLKGIDVVAKEKGWAKATVDKKRSQVNQFSNSKAATGDYYFDNFSRIELFFSKMLFRKFSSKEEFDKAYYLPWVYITRVRNRKTIFDPDEFKRYCGTVVTDMQDIEKHDGGFFVLQVPEQGHVDLNDLIIKEVEIDWDLYIKLSEDYE